MIRPEITNRIAQAGAVAILRVRRTHSLLPAAEALAEGGVQVLEVTLTSPNALPSIKALTARFAPEIIIGAGSVISAAQVQEVADQGARFIVSPVTKREVIEAAHALDLPVMPGVFTPSEAQAAHELAADMIKVFPAGFLGKGYIKALLAPLPHLRLVPTGGVTPASAGEWIDVGAAAIGIGSALADERTIAEGRYHVLTERARVLCASISEARQSTKAS